MSTSKTFAAHLRPEDSAHIDEIRRALPIVAPDLLPNPTSLVRVALRIAAQELRRRRLHRERIEARRRAQLAAKADADGAPSSP